MVRCSLLVKIHTNTHTEVTSVGSSASAHLGSLLWEKRSCHCMCFFFQSPISCQPLRWTLKGLGCPGDIMFQSSCCFVESIGFGPGSPNDVLSGGYVRNETGKKRCVQLGLELAGGTQQAGFRGELHDSISTPLLISKWPTAFVRHRALRSSCMKLWYCLITVVKWIQFYFVDITS